MSKKLEEELKERLYTKTLTKMNSSMSGSCISNTLCYTTDNDESIFVKTNASPIADAMFRGEFESLRQINITRTIRAPKPLLVLSEYDSSQACAIVMEFLNIKPLRNECAKTLGKHLASLHDYNNKFVKYSRRASKWIGGKQPSAKRLIEVKEANMASREDSIVEDEEELNQFAKHSINIKGKEVGSFATESSPVDNQMQDESSNYPNRFVPEPGTQEISLFGFPVPTSCGLISQTNEWNEDWVAFYARHRLDKPIRSLLSDHGDRELMQQWSHLQLKIDKFFTDINHKNDDEKIIPALLHGDLWSGNVAQLNDDSRPVVYDPSSFYGHSEYDFGIARMFGGIPRIFEESYFEIMPKRKLFEKRNKLYQLFHHLNHWDHFGSGYRASSLSLIKELNALV